LNIYSAGRRRRHIQRRPTHNVRPDPKKATALPIDAQIKHLEFIQSVISRLATDSFLAKGWALTVSGALYGFATIHLNPWIALVGLMPAVTFWWLDAYFLRGERLFRCLYEDARKPDTSVELFSMNVDAYRGDQYSAWRNVIFSQTLRVFYSVLLIVGLIIFVVSVIHESMPVHAARTRPAISSSASSRHGSLGGHIFPM
jgi:hypothetical protein